MNSSQLSYCLLRAVCSAAHSGEHVCLYLNVTCLVVSKEPKVCIGFVFCFYFSHLGGMGKW